MGTNPEMDALRKARTRQKIIETAFHVFAERTIDAVTADHGYQRLGMGSVHQELLQRCMAERDGGGDVRVLHGRLHRPLP